MRTRNLLEGVPIFLAVAETLSFTRAAKSLGITPSAASQAVRTLEARLGSTLLNRSTRSLSLTSAGQAYVQQAAPALAALVDATLEASKKSDRLVGTVRLTMPRAAFDGVVAHALPSFRLAYPDVIVEIEIEGMLVDIIESNFDAGLRYGRLLAKGTTSVQVFPASQGILAASPMYLADRKPPASPDELQAFDLIACRSRTNGLLTTWSLVSASGTRRIEPRAAIIASDLMAQIDLSRLGLGISCTPKQCIAPYLEHGSLVQVLPEWSVPLEPIYLYHPARSAKNPILRAFVEHLRSHMETVERFGGAMSLSELDVRSRSPAARPRSRAKKANWGG